MKKKDEIIEILDPKNQLQLHGYNDYFKTFVDLFDKNKLPNVILLSGQSGAGKSTFAYHFINYLLSYKENNNYNLEQFIINSNNKSYINLCNDTHSNFFLLESEKFDENIKIEKIRNIIKFLNKSTYLSGFKVILIDNAEYMNLHSSNALLKALEEANNRTFFFLIHNNSSKILETIKSRSIEFKIFFTSSEKKEILRKIIKQYDNFVNVNNIDELFYFESVGNIMKYLYLIKDSGLNLLEDKLSCLLYLIDKNKQKNDPRILKLISLLIEIFYHDLSLKNSSKLNLYSSNRHKLLKEIDDSKKYNLDKKNLYIYLKYSLQNEK